ncbi:S49 family peptidase [Halobaculum sp. MBLA0143]|uniref:S49 family peptidase n=1 Tax=Halobaculum sp. MBLA0143 TaxID=3079933 RepID=UPI0035260117
MTALRSYTVLVIAALVVGAVVVPSLAGTPASPDRVVVVEVDERITDDTALQVTRQLRSLRDDDSVAAVVLRVSSPGGSAAASEAMYLSVRRLAAEKPVVTSVGGLAMSGAYYTAVGSDEILVTPASLVGHVGVIAFAPSGGLSPSATTGPDKASGGLTRDQFFTRLESIKRAFVGAVMTERGEELTVSRSVVGEASAFSGSKAVENGYADGIGGVEAAIAAAADRAEVSDYRVQYTDPAQPARGLSLGSNTTVAATGPGEYRGVDTVRYLMLYGVPEADGQAYNATAAAEVGA